MAIVENQMVEVRWSNKNKKHYLSQGYVFTKNGESFHVPITHLSTGSSAEIQLKCDTCEKTYNKKYSSIINYKNNFCSRDCQNKFLVGKPSWNSNKIIVNCDHCYKEIERSANEKNRSKHLFCSKECSDKFKIGKNLETKTVKHKLNCFYCHKDIIRTEKELKRYKTHFCSHACSSLYSKGKENLKNRIGETVSCHNCSKSFHLSRNRIENQQHYFCNNACRLTWMKSADYQSKFGKGMREDPGTFVTKKCYICNIDVTRKWWEFKSDNCICSKKECRILHTKNNNPKQRIAVNCQQCEKEFKTVKSVKDKNKWLFCSRDCYANFRSEYYKGENIHGYQDIRANCDNCSIQVKVTKYYLKNNKNVFCGQQCYYEFRSKHYVGEKHPQFGLKKSPEQIEKMRIATARRIANGEFSQTTTSIHIKVRDLLSSLLLNFEEEKQFKYYVLDFFLDDLNLAIEVMGDYWHANPIKYTNYALLHDIQKKDIIRDKSKRTYLKKNHNVTVLYLWEKDINHNIELCKTLVKNFCDNKGILVDYNSFNYNYVESMLSLKEKQVQPFFLRANTIYQKTTNI